MSEAVSMTISEVRRFILIHQSLWPPQSLSGASGVLDYLRRVRCIQFDPLNIVGHNHELALQARVADFRPELLKRLLYKDRLLLDGWDKNMSIYPVEDWPYFARYRAGAKAHLSGPDRPANEVCQQVRDIITERGAISSRDIDFGQTVDWSWAPTRLSRAALESMYFWGELIIYDKVNTRKVYDFAHRHLPEALLSASDPNKTEDEYRDWYVARRIGSMGLSMAKSHYLWMGTGLNGQACQESIERLVSAGILREVCVEGIRERLFARSCDLDRAQLSYTNNMCSDYTPFAVLIAPLDNLLWDRNLTEKLFGFHYRWEVYKPSRERQYGYYVLPMLYEDKFIARCEPKRDKKRNLLVINGFWWEPGVIKDEEALSAAAECLLRFAAYHGLAGVSSGGDASGTDSASRLIGQLALYSPDGNNT